MISSSTAAEVARGVSPASVEEGYSPILEFTLPNGRRLDVAAMGPGGEMLGVEIKVALADLRGDSKWPEYLDYCDLFYFAIPPDFPPEHVPQQTGLIVADRYGGAIVKEARSAVAACQPPQGGDHQLRPRRGRTAVAHAGSDGASPQPPIWCCPMSEQELKPARSCWR